MLSTTLDKALTRLADELFVTVRKWRKQTLGPEKPKPITFLLISERENPGMADTLQFKAVFPAVTDPDVVKRSFALYTEDEAGARTEVVAPTEFDLTVSEYPTLIDVPQDSNVVSILSNIDDGGNTKATEQKFVAKDTLEPAAPGDVRFELVSEVEGDQPTA